VKMNSIKLMATAMIVIVGLISIVVFGFFSYKNTKTSLEKKYFSESELVLEHSLLAFQDVFENAEQFIGQLAQEEEVRTAATTSEPFRLNVFFQLLQKALPNSSSIKLGLENGRLFIGPSVSLPPGYDPRSLNWFILAKQQEGQVVWTEPYLDYLDQKIIITAAQTVQSTVGGINGVLAVDYELSSISRSISHSNIGNDGFVMLLNHSGKVIAKKGNDWIGEQIFGGELERIVKNGQMEQTKFSLRGNPYYLRIGKLNENGMLVITAISKKEIEENLFAAQLPIFIIGVICLTAFGIAAYFFALRGIKPLQRLVALMKSAEQGNYEIHANIYNYNEINLLANGFNNMIDSIKKRDLALHASNQQILHLAYYDALTGLLNRRNLIETINKAISMESHSSMALIYIDLDNFKTINDTMGHTTGDIVLVEVARRLQAIHYSHLDVARIGGDEFIMMLYDMESRVIIDGVMYQIIEALEEPIQIGTKNYNTSASIGVALYPEHGVNMEELLQKADMAMYRSKAKGKNQYSIFDESIQMEITRKANIEYGIREALRDQAFELYYQPLYNVSEERIESVEALIRCKSPLLHGVPILDIIQIAEETGLIISIDKWVLKNAFSFATMLNVDLRAQVKVSVNVSANHIMQPDFVYNVQEALEESGTRPEWIGLEITETVMMESFDSSKKKLEELKKLNIHILLDDFGTGYSSLNYLKSLPIDYVKIDKSFIDEILHSDQDGRMIRTMVELCHNIGLKVVAEGVEHQDQMKLLRKYQCDMLQGYYFSRPVQSGEIVRMLGL
jgi:diguanylate cyclase (GGDEF)-like protein